MNKKPISISTTTFNGYLVTTVLCDDGSLYRQIGLSEPFEKITGPWNITTPVGKTY